MDLQIPIKGLKDRVFKMYARRLEKLGIQDLEDFLYHVPSRYEDFSIVSTIANTQPGETVTIKGKILKIENIYARSYKKIQKAQVGDETGQTDVVWFNQPFILESIKKGDKVSLAGKVDLSKGKKVLISPDYEIDNGDLIHTGRLVPVYPQTHGVSSKWLRRQIYKILSEDKLDDFLPEKLRKENSLMGLPEAIRKVHFPESLDEAKEARVRLSFDEVFLLHLSSLKRKGDWKKKLRGTSLKIFEKKVNDFIKNLPFELTLSQKESISEILSDLGKDIPMNRLLQGDVGSGKTVVSAIAMYLAYLNSFKSILMSPTEILANQHYRTIKSLFSPFGIKVGLQTSSRKTKGDFDVVIGTHAILFEKTKLDNLGLVVIDEQQRFGVEQRSILRGKGNNPHLLTMTATPIPRTVALTFYGDLDLSTLTDMPKGRKIIKTWLVPPTKRTNSHKWIEKQLRETKSQAFVVCPFIEESENMTSVKAATKEFERLRKAVFPNLRLGLLHGKMKSKEKEEVLKKFGGKKLDILVATPVVEVGIDFPNATIILIETSERFGLAQLHQLRGRVGRGDKESYCLLFTESSSPQTIQRLRSMEKIQIGAELAELDLKLRGPGEIYGTAQHGIPTLKVASFSDFDLIQKTKKEAEKIIDDLDKFPLLKQKVSEINVRQVSPD
ncbi:MAG: ATP-dependent DNA helicase [Candidatus Levybacteria bacterium GW2011_GWA2_40_8]|nr:MAG: ATP-dependent DNA helicase [Candidatus Levybacteria bacterium GW2011_GWA2_40_8]